MMTVTTVNTAGAIQPNVCPHDVFTASSVAPPTVTRPKMAIETSSSARYFGLIRRQSSPESVSTGRATVPGLVLGVIRRQGAQLLGDETRDEQHDPGDRRADG